MEGGIATYIREYEELHVIVDRCLVVTPLLGEDVSFIAGCDHMPAQ